MMFRIYNTFTRKKEAFKPRINKKVAMYVCGPTVYGPSHLGHVRTYLAFDLILRSLRYFGYKVKFISNITDVHDDIVKEVKTKKVPFKTLVAKYEKEYFTDLKSLNISKADKYPKVSGHIKEIIRMIQKLLRRGFAYRAGGSVYFDISKFKSYGKLSHRKLKKARTGTRVATDKYERKEASDFALWKASPKNEIGWNSPFGYGRPGWHIECSVMSSKYLGDQIDVHGGGPDLIFPHHENEIAQSEAASGKTPFVKYWLHAGALSINSRKMSRSLGNFITIQDALKRYRPQVIRFFFLSYYWRRPIDWNAKALENAKEALKRINEFETKTEKLAERKEKPKPKIKKLTVEFKKEFEMQLLDDFNTPKALAALFSFIKKTNRVIGNNGINPADAKLILKAIDLWREIFGITRTKDKIPAQVMNLVKQRERLRKARSWSRADQLRKKIEEAGYLVEDTPSGPLLRPKS